MRIFPLLEGTVLMGLCVTAIPGWAQKSETPTTTKPNIIYIMCDDMGYGDLGCYGQKYISTPHIDNMASEGMRFTQAYAGSPVSAPLARFVYDRTTLGTLCGKGQ